MADASSANRSEALAEPGGHNYFAQPQVGNNGNQVNGPIILQFFNPRDLGRGLAARWPFNRLKPSRRNTLLIGLAAQIVFFVGMIGGIAAPILLHFLGNQPRSK